MLKYKVIRNIFIAINVLTVIWQIMCIYASNYDTSTSYSFISIFSFTLPFATVANVFFSIFWILVTKRWRWLALLSLITIVFTWHVAKSVFGVHPFSTPGSEAQTKTPQLKIMTYNVHLFDLGEWAENNAVQRKILEIISEENPDVLCMQEFYVHKRDDKLPFTAAIAELGYPYYQFNEVTTYNKRFITSNAAPKEKVGVGNIIFSKYPLSNIQEFDLSNGYQLISSDINIDSKYNISLLVTHLQSVRFGEKEMAYIDKVKGENIESTEKSATKNILRKLALASSLRAAQANSIDSIKKVMKYPTIICGDFNDVPGSYVYQTILRGMNDPFVQKGWGLSRTFNKISPTLRIDHILYDKTFWKTESYKVVYENLSDHYPVIAELSLKTND